RQRRAKSHCIHKPHTFLPIHFFYASRILGESPLRPVDLVRECPQSRGAAQRSEPVPESSRSTGKSTLTRHSLQDFRPFSFSSPVLAFPKISPFPLPQKE